MEGWKEMKHLCERILCPIGTNNNVSGIHAIWSDPEEPWARQVAPVPVKRLFSVCLGFSQILCV